MSESSATVLDCSGCRKTDGVRDLVEGDVNEAGTSGVVVLSVLMFEAAPMVPPFSETLLFRSREPEND